MDPLFIYNLIKYFINFLLIKHSFNVSTYKRKQILVQLQLKSRYKLKFYQRTKLNML